MNILFVANEYPKRGKPTTGFPNYLYRVSLALIELGHKPMILTAGNADSHRIEQGIRIQTVMVPLIYGDRWRTAIYIYNAMQMGMALNRKIGKIMKEVPIDVIQFPSLFGLATFYHGKVPAVLRLSSYAKIAYPTSQTFSKIQVKVMTLAERMSAKRCNAIFAPCKNTAEAFEKDCHRKVRVIETPFVNDVHEEELQFYDKQLVGKKYALFFGALYTEKGIFVIADVLKQFLENNPDYYFVFIGQEYKVNGVGAARILREKAGKCVSRVIISNALPHNQLYPVISRAEFVVLPSLMDNLPNACIEAMYFQQVVIGTNGASFDQLIRHGENGLLCKIGDSADLLEKMETAVSMTKEEKQRMGELARNRVNKLKPRCAAQKLVYLYEYVIKKQIKEKKDEKRNFSSTWYGSRRGSRRDCCRDYIGKKD